MSFFDKNPVTEDHILVIPKHHISDYFEIRADERLAIQQLLEKSKVYCDENFQLNGYNVGVNIGTVADKLFSLSYSFDSTKDWRC